MVGFVGRATRRRVAAADTSSLQRFLRDDRGADVDTLAELARTDDVYLPPVVLTEALSDPMLPLTVVIRMQSFPLLEFHDGYWERAGTLRATLRRDGFKAKLADCLIAQSCIDHDIALITYDRDFRHFVRAGLALA
jgi:predicted nucleic acid-binding protein